ncbi:AAA family ATPase [Flavobacterium sp. JP2137]|uniref:AAA family ATPase n=1 Tax=Flavobacterium sp. JP2137 TaxID=3414510 RepID=UPI003D30025E
MNIIARKEKGFYGTKNGLIKPLFEVTNNDYKLVNHEDYPNSGNIFITAGFDNFEDDYLYIFASDKLQDNTKNYETDLTSFNEGSSTKNPCFKILTFHNSTTRKLPPNELIPIYQNKFDKNVNRLFTTEGINNRIFFLEDVVTKTLYGPFERNGNELKAAKFGAYEDDFENDDEFLEFLDIYSEFDGNIIFSIKINNAENFILIDNDKNVFLANFKDFISNNIGDPIDFTPTDELHKWVIERLQNKAPKIASTLTEIKNIVSTLDSQTDKLKWKKYTQYLENIQNDEEDIEQLVRVLNDKKFNNSVDNTINVEELEKENRILKEDRDSKGKELADLKEEVKTKLEDLNSQLEEEKLKKQEHSYLDATLYPRISKILNSKEKLEETEKLLKESQISSELTIKITRLEARIEVYEDQIKKKEEDVRKLEVAVQEINKNFAKSATEHSVKLAEAKMYTDLLNGINIKPNISVDLNSKIVTPQISIPQFEVNNAKSLISEVKERLSKQGRSHISFNDVANIVITINQSFLTIIAGAPGVGKTSLVEKLAKSYGLNDNFGYLEIPCAKGWTSSKDLIGFFNPLTNKFQPAKTKLKGALEKSSAHLNSPYIVLLDEANLSPMEHYWSDFIKLADTNYTRKIKISDDEEIEFGDGFRFIATINHDHTTETLSNRLIDRASIIQIEKPENPEDVKDTLENVETIYDFYDSKNLFIKTKKWQEDEGIILGTLKLIKEKLESSNSGINISPRKEIAITKYCKVATGLLEGNSYTALDYAVSQHILPLVNGRGEDFEEVLIGLKEILNNKAMSKSEKLLNKIIQRGKGLKHFKYIYY